MIKVALLALVLPALTVATMVAAIRWVQFAMATGLSFWVAFAGICVIVLAVNSLVRRVAR